MYSFTAKSVQKIRSFTPTVVSIPPKCRVRGTALLLHKTAPLRLRSIRSFDRHSNYQELLNIVNSLLELGFRVTVVDRSCPETELPMGRYDVVMGLAAGNSGLRLPALFERSPRALKIGYCAGPEPGWSNQAIRERYEHAFSYRGLDVPVRLLRAVDPIIRDVALEMSDALIIHGNNHTSSTFRIVFPDKPKYQVPGIALSRASNFDSRTPIPPSFLAVGGDGAVTKGIDLVVDASIEVHDARFGYCGPVEEDLLVLFGGKLPVRQNWTSYGFVYAKSGKFLKITRNYSFGILPSSSEGMATSVLTMMAHGLVPIVTEECGVDVRGFGVIIRVNESVVPTIRKLLNMSTFEILKLRERSFFAGLSYSAAEHKRMLSIHLKLLLGS